MNGFPAAGLGRPFWRVTAAGTQTTTAEPCFALHPPALTALAALAPGAFPPIARRWNQGREEILTIAAPGWNMAGLTLFAEAPIGRLLADNEWARTMARLLLAIFLPFSLVLALQAARTFLFPVAALVERARAIMAGDVSGRLPVFPGREFAVLAQAFNSMAAGVESGMRLRLFVSDSVRTAARDAERHQIARAGELRTAAIVFAGAAGFSELVRSVSASQLITRTNRHLRALSPLVREQGGDIDKFIGDKILAVFPVDAHRTPRQAVEAAIAAAMAMQNETAGGEAWQRPFGVGIVLGDVLAGIMGTAEVRLECTVIGDTVNLASRLADLAKTLDRSGRPGSHGEAVGGTVIDDAAWEALGGPVSWQRLRLPPIKGKSRAVGAHWLPPSAG